MVLPSVAESQQPPQVGVPGTQAARQFWGSQMLPGEESVAVQSPTFCRGCPDFRFSAQRQEALGACYASTAMFLASPSILELRLTRIIMFHIDFV